MSKGSKTGGKGGGTVFKNAEDRPGGFSDGKVSVKSGSSYGSTDTAKGKQDAVVTKTFMAVVKGKRTQFVEYRIRVTDKSGATKLSSPKSVPFKSFIKGL